MKRVAIFVDGDNLSPCHGSELMKLGQARGRVDVIRVYGDVTNLGAWLDMSGVRTFHAGRGKNAADILLALDASELCAAGAFDVVVLASSDSDFAHLSHRLRERGIALLGAGEAKTSKGLRDACTEFVVLGQAPHAAPEFVSGIDQKIHDVITGQATTARGILIQTLSTKMRNLHSFKISELEESNWRRYLSKRPRLFELEPKGPDAHVRSRPKAFAKSA